MESYAYGMKMKKPEGADQAPAKNQGGSGGGAGHHAHMAAEFRKRFWISLGLTLVVDLVKKAQESKSKTQDLANTAAKPGRTGADRRPRAPNAHDVVWHPPCCR